MDIIETLRQEGYMAVEGKEAVKRMIKSAADLSNERLCSGFRVFPDGDRCEGCSDCKKP